MWFRPQRDSRFVFNCWPTATRQGFASKIYMHHLVVWLWRTLKNILGFKRLASANPMSYILRLYLWPNTNFVCITTTCGWGGKTSAWINTNNRKRTTEFLTPRNVRPLLEICSYISVNFYEYSGYQSFVVGNRKVLLDNSSLFKRVERKLYPQKVDD